MGGCGPPGWQEVTEKQESRLDGWERKARERGIEIVALMGQVAQSDSLHQQVKIKDATIERVRAERDETLQAVDHLRDDRDTLQRRVDLQHSAIERLEAEVKRLRGVGDERAHNFHLLFRLRSRQHCCQNAFPGMYAGEINAALGISTRTVHRSWRRWRKADAEAKQKVARPGSPAYVGTSKRRSWVDKAWRAQDMALPRARGRPRKSKEARPLPRWSSRLGSPGSAVNAECGDEAMLTI